MGTMMDYEGTFSPEQLQLTVCQRLIAERAVSPVKISGRDLQGGFEPSASPPFHVCSSCLVSPKFAMPRAKDLFAESPATPGPDAARTVSLKWW